MNRPEITSGQTVQLVYDGTNYSLTPHLRPMVPWGFYVIPALIFFVVLLKRRFSKLTIIYDGTNYTKPSPEK